ncbi:hypothetical protein HDU91_007465, partial [Kappamyces sp. JEL0680]
MATLSDIAITDLKLVKTRQGTSRRFCYVGFKNDAMGARAIAHFHNSFFDTCRLEVVAAKSIGDDSIDRPWSKYSQGSSAHTQQTAPKAAEEPKQETALNHRQKQFLAEIGGDDEDFKEFLEVMRPRGAGASKTWQNDDVTAVRSKEPQHLAGEDDDLYQDLPAEYPGEADDSGSDTELVAAPADNSHAFDTSLSDMDYLRLKMKQSAEKEKTAEPPETMRVNPGRLAILHESGAVDSEAINNVYDATASAPPAAAGATQQTEVVEAEPQQSLTETPSPDLIADTGRIMVRNLAYSSTYEDVEEHFKAFGPIAELHMPIDKITKESKGYAFVLYVIPEHAINAYVKLDKSIFQGRIIEVVAAKEKPKA